MPHSDRAGGLEVQVGWGTGYVYQRVNRGVAAMLDGTGGVVTVVHRYRNGLYPGARAHHNVNAFTAGVGHHCVERGAQGKPHHSQHGNGHRQLIKKLLQMGYITNVAIHWIALWRLLLRVVNQGKP